MKKITLLLISLFLSIVASAANKRSIYVEVAGTLSSMISDEEKYSIEELTLTGKLNGLDFRLIREMAGNDYHGKPTAGKLRKLDLSGAVIVAGADKYLDTKVVTSSTGSYSDSFSSVATKNNVLGNYMFAGCDKLKDLILPNSITSIGDLVFWYCLKLKSLIIPEKVSSIGTQVIFGPNNITTLGVAEGNKKFSSPANSNAVMRGTKLILACSKTQIPEGTTIIGEWAFIENDKISEVVLPKGVKTIEDFAFNCCYSLASVTIPKSTTTIGNSAFGGCPLSDVYCYAKKVPSTGKNIFSNLSKATLHVPPSALSAYQTTSPWNKFGSIVELTDYIEEPDDDVTPDTPDNPDTPDTPDNPDTPDTPDTPDIPDTPAPPNNDTKREFFVKVAGTLSSMISDEEKYSIGELTLTGKLNGQDFRLIREMAGNDYHGRPSSGRLRKLDLSGADIVSGGLEYLDTDWIESSNGSGMEGNLHFHTEDNILGHYMFAGCDKLEDLILPNSIISIGYDVFWFCLNLKALIIPENVSYIGAPVFFGANNITTLGVALGNKWFSSPANSNAVMDGTKLVLACSKTQIPEGTTIIGGWAFCLNNIISNLVLPNGIKAIEDYAFYNCNRLASVTIPKSTTTIGNSAFGWCPLSDVYCYAKKVPSTGDNVFTDLSKATLHVPPSALSVYQTTSPWNNFGSIVELTDYKEEPDAPDYDTKREIFVEVAGTLSSMISDEEKYSIEELTLTGKLNGQDFRLIREMAGNDFQGRPTAGMLRKLDLSGADIVSGGLEYLDTDWIKSSNGSGMMPGPPYFHFKTKDNELGNGLFVGCEKLEELILPNSITSIGNYIFWYCFNLKALIIPENVSYIGAPVISGPNSITTLGVAEGNKKYSSPANSNAVMEGTKLVLACSKTQIPEGTTIIGGWAFSGNDEIKNIVLPEGITTIGQEAFSSCYNLASITIPQSVSTIGESAFVWCPSLRHIYCYATRLPNTGNSLITNTYTTTIHLHVPPSALSKYVVKSPWKELINIVEITNYPNYPDYTIELFDSLCSPKTYKQDTGYYNLRGQRIKTPNKGIYIVKMKDGTSKKVFVK